MREHPFRRVKGGIGRRGFAGERCALVGVDAAELLPLFFQSVDFGGASSGRQSRVGACLRYILGQGVVLEYSVLSRKKKKATCF
jgi:hypothetical protein